MKLNKIRKLQKIKTKAPATEEVEDEIPVIERPHYAPFDLDMERPLVEEDDFEVVIEDETEVPVIVNQISDEVKIDLPEVKGPTKDRSLKPRHEKPSIQQIKNESANNSNKVGLVAHVETQANNGPSREQISKKLREIKKSISFVNSIIEPVQTLELKNHMIGKLARVFCMYRVNEIIVYNDESFAKEKRESGFDPSEFIVKILQYLETPQYLRKRLFPISALLRNVGLLTPLECLHHLKIEDISEYREGVVLKRPTRENEGSWVDIGLMRVK
jgi:hypothetical protein